MIADNYSQQPGNAEAIAALQAQVANLQFAYICNFILVGVMLVWFVLDYFRLGKDLRKKVMA